MHLHTLAQAVKSLLKDGKVQEACETLVEGLKGHTHEKIAIIQSVRDKKLREAILTNSIDSEKVNIDRNKVISTLLEITDELYKEGKKNVRVYIAYPRDGDSTNLAKFIFGKLQNEGFTPFLNSESISVGSDWVSAILKGIREADYFIEILGSGMSPEFVREVEEARRNFKKYSKPVILPIKINLSKGKIHNSERISLIERIKHIEWRGEKDNNVVLEKLMEVINGIVEPVLFDDSTSSEHISILKSRPEPRATFEVPRGAVFLGSPFYIKRLHEDKFIRNVTEPSALLRVKGPRQYGKTSLLNRLTAYADERNHSVVAIDFQEISEKYLMDLNDLLWEFCSQIAYELELEDELNARWKDNRDPKQMARYFIEKDILKRDKERSLLLAIDESDRLFNYPKVSSDFFLMLRAWHERGKSHLNPEWKRFKIAISYSTEAKLFIQDLNASPFNVGEEAFLTPFSFQDIVKLSSLHGLLLEDYQIETLLNLLGGQPFLIRRALYLIAMEIYTYEQLIDRAIEQDGPFNDHLKHHLINVSQSPQTIETLKAILNGEKTKNIDMAMRLIATGLVKGTPPNLEASFDLYKRYFKGKL